MWKKDSDLCMSKSLDDKTHFFVFGLLRRLTMQVCHILWTSERQIAPIAVKLDLACPNKARFQFWILVLWSNIFKLSPNDMQSCSEPYLYPFPLLPEMTFHLLRRRVSMHFKCHQSRLYERVMFLDCISVLNNCMLLFFVCGCFLHSLVVFKLFMTRKRMSQPLTIWTYWLQIRLAWQTKLELEVFQVPSPQALSVSPRFAILHYMMLDMKLQ